MHSAYQIRVTGIYSRRIDIDKKSLYFSHWSEVGAPGNGTSNPAAVFYFHRFASACDQQLLPITRPVGKSEEEVADTKNDALRAAHIVLFRCVSN
ncbi:MAG: hypothetical protein PPHEMADM_1486 [uncultured Paraburkholderia sp.]|nr:MAG: hypothetical protein PPHEMADE_1505 [uncultured Paraburkholderia sp.]CAH2915798.1 MAG: hypothetical protein PPHEMADM_1486 [uncultured Paraburkholderia sp.]